MKADHVTRGDQLLAGSKRVGGGKGLLARCFSGGISRFLDKVDRGLIQGALKVDLPDGTSRILGGHGAGFEAHVVVHEWRAIVRAATGGSVGFFQAWDTGELECDDLVGFFALIMANSTALGETGRAKGPWRLLSRLFHWFNRNSKEQSEKNIHAHYDLGNDFYAQWLDRTMTYSSAYQMGDDGLEAAQRRKWARLADRIGDAGQVLEIGCGWGSFSNFLAGQGRAVTAISLSDAQLDWAREHFDPGIELRHQDYRDIAGQFDGIVSVEMVEAVGREYWPAFFDCLARCLKPGGRAAIQFIAMRDDLFESYARNADFIQAYIFPGGLLIKTSEFQKLAEKRGLIWSDQEDFALDYAETLKQWRADIDVAAAQNRLPAGFDDRFLRLWRFYLMYCEGGFRGGGITVSQTTLTNSGTKSGSD